MSKRPSAKRLARMREILAAPFEVGDLDISWGSICFSLEDASAQETLQDVILCEVCSVICQEFRLSPIVAEEEAREVELNFLKYLPLEMKDAEIRLKRAIALCGMDLPLVIASFTRDEWLELAARAWDEAQVKSVQTT